MTTLSILKAARELLTPEGAWTQGAWARDDTQRSVDLNDEGACSWCLMGALGRVHGSFPVPGEIIAKLRGIAAYPFNESAVDWNDTDGRTQSEVVRLLDRAIAAETEASK